ncbi:hypothetical protein QQ045_008883 [Rhodiola kirilowii]
MAESDAPRHTCLKLVLSDADPVFVKGTWFESRFDLEITDGFDAWICNATEDEVEDRASQWDQPVAEYVQLAERYLGFQHPDSVYKLVDAGDGQKRLSWTFEKEGIKLEWRWKCKPAVDRKRVTTSILDFLMDANITLSEEVVRKDKSFERLKAEAEKCLAQSERFAREKEEFEAAIYAKFVGVLNSKKAKLRVLRDRLSKEPSSKSRETDEESTEKTSPFDEDSNDEYANTGTSKEAPASRYRGRGRGWKQQK